MNNTLFNKSFEIILFAVTVLYLLPLYLVKAVDNYFFDEDATISDRLFFYGSYAVMIVSLIEVINVVY